MTDHLGPDDRDLDDGGLDLSPRHDGPAKVRSGPSRRWGAVAVLALLGVVLAFIVVQAKDASLYFRNADEAVAQKESLGTSRFRLQGTVVGKPVEEDNITIFTVAYNGEAVEVRHSGVEPAMFETGIPVVAEGRWSSEGPFVDGDYFDSDRLLVKHDEDYKDYDEENPQRLDGDESNDS